MNAAGYRTLERKIARWTKTWEKRLGVQHFEIEHAFLDSFYGDDGEEDFKVTAVTECRWNYLEAKIKWYLPSAIRHDDDKLEQILVHELCHVLLSPEQGLADELAELGIPEVDVIADGFTKQREMATEMAARAIWKAYILD